MKKILAIVAAVVFIFAFFVLPYITLLDMTLFSSIMLVLQAGGGSGILGIILYAVALILAVVGLVMIFMNKANKYKFILYAGILAAVAAAFDLITSGSASSYLGIGYWVILISAIGMIVAGVLKE